jgi:DNA repair protein RecN (Recombination protein N)|tara:strand:- start:1043 stop:2698 length:1656 start_codon:yes stop_codon:yes gene_type:complete
MLRGLRVRDILIIDQLELNFQHGLNVLTGETGAGKSILLDCLGFVLGWRGRAELVRQGAEQGEVIAWFDIHTDHPVNDILRHSGIELEGELILRRITTRDGRKTAFVNDCRCSGQVLRQIGETLLELHGQHDDRGLLNIKGHMALLDEHAMTIGLRDACRDAWREFSRAKGALIALAEKINTLATEEEYLRHTVDELQLLDVQLGDDDRLDAHRRMMQAAVKIRIDVAKALEALSAQGAEGLVSDATRWLATAAKQLDGQLDPASEALDDVLNRLGEAQQEIESVLSELNFNASELEKTEERLFAIRAAARKHAVAPDELPKIARILVQKLETLDSGTAGLDALKLDLDLAHSSYKKLAQNLHEARVVGASALDKGMALELAPLKMERAIFKTEIIEVEGGPNGSDTVAFTVATNPGAPTGPLEKIASGGELSRFLLALKVCLSQGSSQRTIIFDEIDRGVGGATADAVGRRLAELGAEGQVLVVTHSPQVAAFGNAHWRVEKRIEDEVTFSTVVKLMPEDRIDEIARMLAGDVVTDEARGAARSLLKINK